MSSDASIWQGQSGIIPVVNTAGNLFVENQVATAGQTVFTLASFQYTPGTNSIFVFKNGLLLKLATAYTETDNSHVTLAAGANVGDVLTFVAFAVSQVTPTFYQNGVPPAGTTGQLLAKKSNSDYDLNWISLASLPVLTDGPRTNVASASTTDLTGVATTTRNILITGNLEIDGFLVGSGEVFFVKFQSALLLKNNAAITTGTGVDIGTSPGDTCLLRATGANTVEILCYSRWASPHSVRKQDFRLTLVTGVPVPVGDVVNAGTLYLTPYTGDQISLYNGKGWETLVSPEISISLAGTAANSAYDIFAYNNNGAVTLELTAWTNAISRASALSRQNGILCKSTDLTRRYIGSICTVGAAHTEDSLRQRLVWNYYNRVMRPLQRTETSGNWNYASAVIRQANANQLNQFNIMIGVVEDQVEIKLEQLTSNTVASVEQHNYIGVNSTTVAGGTSTIPAINAGAGAFARAFSNYVGQASLGFNFYAWLENVPAPAGSCQFFGSTNASFTGTTLG